MSGSWQPIVAPLSSRVHLCERHRRVNFGWMRIVGVAGCVLVGMAVAAAIANGMRERRAQHPPPPITHAQMMRAFETERAVAEAMHMTRAEEGDTPLVAQGVLTGSWGRELRIDARECVAIVAAVEGGHGPVVLALQPVSAGLARVADGDLQPLVETRADGGLVAQIQWCEVEARTRAVVLETRAVSDLAYERPLRGSVHWAIYRANWSAVGGIPGLRRGVFRSWALRNMSPDYALAVGDAHAPSDGRLLGAAVPLHLGSARLLPSTAEVYRALYARVRGRETGAVNPRVDVSRPEGVPWEAMLPTNFSELYASLRGTDAPVGVHDPWIAAPDIQGLQRTLTVIDLARLGAPCVALVFTRLLYGHRAKAWRYDPSVYAAGVALEGSDNVVVDRHCPARGLTLYATEAHDADDWALRVYAVPAPENAREEESTRNEHPRRHRRRGHR
jgi:hypothetical protein